MLYDNYLVRHIIGLQEVENMNTLDHSERIFYFSIQQTQSFVHSRYVEFVGGIQIILTNVLHMKCVSVCSELLRLTTSIIH